MKIHKSAWPVLWSLIFFLPARSPAQIYLGDAPKIQPPKNLPPPGFTPTPLDITITGGFTVNTDSREQVRSFYNGIYATSDNVPMNSTADVTNCTPGENSTAFVQAVARRINWYRAMAGVPANITFNDATNASCQQAATMMSANGTLSHTPPTNWICYTAQGASVAGGDLCIGTSGADAIRSLIWDFGGNNNEVGHRRWLLYPQTQVMGTGDVPQAGSFDAANDTYVFDTNTFGPRPATRKPYVSWPPEGFVPYQVVHPYWSFSLSNADFTTATVTMKSNGVSIAVALQSYQGSQTLNGAIYGENTVVWVPLGLDATCQCTLFPFNGADTLYSITVSNVGVVVNNVTNTIQFSYNVTVFDPAVPGADYVTPAINGPAQPATGVPNLYSCAPINDPNATGYEWIVGLLASGNLVDNANNGLVNFSISPTPDYPIVTSAPDGSGNCFHLCHDNATSQFLQFNELLLPATNTMLSFESLVGYSTSDESARVQASTNGGVTWQDLFVQIGCNTGGQCESTFTLHSLSLSNYAAQPTLLRFNYAFTGGNLYTETDSSVGWDLEGIVITNTQQIVSETTNTPSVTNLISGNLVDNAGGGLANFTFSPQPYYQVITAAQDGSGNCFHLCDDDDQPQILELNEILIPSSNTVVSFSSSIGFATTDETARVQVSTNGGAAWQDIFTQAGCDPQGNGPECAPTFTRYSLSLSNYAGIQTRLRFDYDFSGGYSYPGQTANYLGWCLENIVITNAQQFQVQLLNTTNFTFTPPQTGNYQLQVIPVIFNQFPLAPGPVKAVTAIPLERIVLSQPVLTNNQVVLNFSVNGSLTGFKLLQANQLGAGWTTNTTAVLTTNVPGTSFRFTTTNNAATRFYLIQASDF